MTSFANRDKDGFISIGPRFQIQLLKQPQAPNGDECLRLELKATNLGGSTRKLPHLVLT